MRGIGKPMRFVPALLLTVVVIDPASASRAVTDAEVRQVVAEGIQNALHPKGIGAAVAVRIDGRTLYFNFGFADRASKRPITSDSLFNIASLGKVFDVTLLSLVVRQGEVALDDPVAKYVAELRQGGDIRQVTLGQLATFTSGLSLPQDRPPWPAAHYTLPKFLNYLRNWKIAKDHQRGKKYLYSHAGFMLLHVALERRFGMPYSALLEQRLLRPVDLSSTTLPLRGENSVGLLTPSLKARAVQGYRGDGKRIGKPGHMEGHYRWPGTGQMFSSARDLATLLAAHIGELPLDPLLLEAIDLTHQEVAPIRPNVTQAQAWEVHHGPVTIIDKNAGLTNVTAYIGMIPSKQLGTVILVNRGDLDGRHFGHPILQRLALPDGP
jgi:beta-lactamase class C